MLEHYDILETLQMLEQEHLDIRTVTMGISLVDCACEDTRRFCDNIYDKITGSAQDLVPKTEEIEKKYGIPIINKRVAVTPISIAAAACKNPDFPMIARALDRAAAALGINFHRRVIRPWCRRASPTPTRRLIDAIPRVARSRRRTSAPPSTWQPRAAGINMDAVRADGPDRQAGGRPHGRARLHRLRKTRGVRQRAGGQPVYGGRVPRRRRAGAASSTSACPVPAWCAVAIRTAQATAI